MAMKWEKILEDGVKVHKSEEYRAVEGMKLASLWRGDVFMGNFLDLDAAKRYAEQLKEED